MNPYKEGHYLLRTSDLLHNYTKDSCSYLEELIMATACKGQQLLLESYYYNKTLISSTPT